MTTKGEITMATIKEDYVSFETAKLLKEKRFDELCIWLYDKKGEKHYVSDYHSPWSNSELAADEWSCCTQAVAMKWLREMHNLQIQIAPINFRYKDWTFGIYKDFSPLTIKLICRPTYEEACEAAIKYCLENLI